MADAYNIRCAELEDLPQLFSLDWLSDSEKIERKIASREIFVGTDGGRITGILRYSWFWDQLPFINLLWIEEDSRREGRGLALVEFLIEETEGRNSGKVLTSTQSNEEAQNFWRRIGFEDAGGFVLKGQPFELLMIKYLSTEVSDVDNKI